MDMATLLKNRLAFPPEELAKYAGKYVAWSPDGTRIIASDADELRLDAMIKELGYDPAEILVSPVTDGDGILGKSWLIESESSRQQQTAFFPGDKDRDHGHA